MFLFHHFWFRQGRAGWKKTSRDKEVWSSKEPNDKTAGNHVIFFKAFLGFNGKQWVNTHVHEIA